MFKPRYSTSKWLENFTRGIVAESIFRIWLDRKIYPMLSENYHIINLNIFNPPHSYHPNLKNPFFQLIGDVPDFAIAHVEQNIEYGKGLVGLYQYDKLVITIDTKHERGFHPKSTSEICKRNCDKFNECTQREEVRGWFPESQIGQFEKFYDVLSSMKPNIGFIAWFPLPMLDRITMDIVKRGLIKWCYLCTILGSDFLGEKHNLFDVLEKHMDWKLFDKNIRWIQVDQKGRPVFEDVIRVSSERGEYKNICFNLNKALSNQMFIEFLSKHVPFIFRDSGEKNDQL
jgi:hypothetical protein